MREYQGERLTSSGELPDNSILGPQYVAVDEYVLRIDGLVDRPVELSYEEALSLPHYSKVVTLHCVEGWQATILWEGLRMSDLLNAAGIGSRATQVVLHAVDGYTTSLPVAYVVERDILLAYKMNGVELPPERGFPFQLVAEDKWGYKWIKWVERIELSADDDYEGYWERRGYDNEADLDKPFF